jgi:nitrile hydratase
MASHHDQHERSEQNALRAEALESLLVEKGLVQPEAIDAMVRRYEREIGPMNGAKVVARAWVDPAYRQRLLTDAPAAIAELGFGGPSDPPLVVVANEPGVQNVVVCTLCSCYPTRLLGISPSWYKDPAYRSRVVREPRTVLGEMGLALDDAVEIRVWDSSAELRYMVLPERPPGTEDWTEEQLAALVTRDSLIGVARALAPGAPGGRNARE